HTLHECYRDFQPDPDRRFVSYRSFVASPAPEGMADQIHQAAISGKALGSKELQARMAARFR
ncbi:MAG: transposase, partial [Marinobacter sp.]